MLEPGLGSGKAPKTKESTELDSGTGRQTRNPFNPNVFLQRVRT